MVGQTHMSHVKLRMVDLKGMPAVWDTWQFDFRDLGKARMAICAIPRNIAGILVTRGKREHDRD